MMTELWERIPNLDQQIEQTRREWEVTVDALPQLILLLDPYRRIIRANRTLECWQLGRMAAVKGREVHQLLHPGCTGSNCYLAAFLNQAWEQLGQGQPTEGETEDKILDRFLHLQLQPLAQNPKIGAGPASDKAAVLILDDITKQKQAEATLHHYALELKARNEDLDAFASTVAHSLKEPLLPIIGYAEFLKTSYHSASREVIQKDLDNIFKSGYKMKQIIDELLLLAGIRHVEIELRPLDTAAIIAEAKQRLAYMIEKYEAELVIPPASAWPVALGYAPWVEEIWTNYISNAIKYGGHPPRLEVGATVSEEANGFVRFWIRDDGAGLNSEQQARLFSQFTRLKQINVDGHGLGLSIVRRIVEKLGGQVGVESEGIPGQGCIFSFTLPRA